MVYKKPFAAGSSSESAVEEETPGLSIPDEEEEWSVGDELEGGGPLAPCRTHGNSSGCARFGSLLVHVDVRLVEDVEYPQIVAAAGDATEIGSGFLK